MARPRRSTGPDSRSRLLEAAAAEFAARGYDGVSVDRIARRARLNKAMVYYHFGSKTALYQEVLRDMYRAVGARVRSVADAQVAPPEKMRRFVAAFADEIMSRPQFPSIMLREVVEGAVHLDAESLRLLLAIPLTFAEVLREGVTSGDFEPVHPLLAYFSVLAPIAMLTVGPMRAATASRIGVDLPIPAPEQLVPHLQRAALAMLGVDAAAHGPDTPGERP